MDGIRMVLVGPNEGKTIELGGFSFTDGALVLPPRGSGHAQAILKRYYSAYPEGSLEGQAAQRAWEAQKGDSGTARDSQESSAGAERLKRLEEERAAAEAELQRTRADLREAKAKLAAAAAPAQPQAEEAPKDAPKGGRPPRAKAQAE